MRRRRGLLLAALGVACGAGHGASAQQTGLAVVAGQASMSTPKPNTTIITQSTEKAILNWQSFGIPAGGSVTFQQPNAAAIAVNRVLGGSPSTILGSLSANGQVWLINPAGVLFGRGSSVNVAGLIATTSDINNQDFLNGNYAFGGPAGGGAVVNRGTIVIADGGAAVLSGARVDNHGVITATLGTVVLGGASTYTVDFQGDKLLSFQVKSPVTQGPAKVANSGTINAAGGQVLLTVRAAQNVVDGVLNMGGKIEATTAHEENGEIVLDAGPGGTANVSGTLDVSGAAAGQTGGAVVVTGGTVNLAAGTAINATGAAGGGTVAIGGNLHGAGPVANARTTTVAKGASIDASAITTGSGGTVAVWANGTTSFDGAIAARGGTQSGNGGMVETSGEGTLVVGNAASVTTSAPAGTGGLWLLDPNSNVTITSATLAVTCTGTSSVTCSPTADSSTINAATVIADLNAGSSVTITTNDTGGTQAGTITVSSPIAVTGTTSTSLVLNAASNINVNAAITSSAAPLSVALASTSGSITLAANVITDGASFSATANGSGGSVTENAGVTLSAASPTASGAVNFSVPPAAPAC